MDAHLNEAEINEVLADHAEQIDLLRHFQQGTSPPSLGELVELFLKLRE